MKNRFILIIVTLALAGCSTANKPIIDVMNNKASDVIVFMNDNTSPYTFTACGDKISWEKYGKSEVYDYLYVGSDITDLISPSREVLEIYTKKGITRLLFSGEFSTDWYLTKNFACKDIYKCTVEDFDREYGE